MFAPQILFQCRAFATDTRKYVKFQIVNVINKPIPNAHGSRNSGDKDYACPSFWLDSKINDGIFNIMTGNGMKSFRLKNIDVRRWCHIAICVREGEADLYYKGKLAYTGILGDYCKINEDSLYIGRNGGFDGLLYRLQYTPDFLTPQQVANFASKSPPINKKYFS